MSLLLLISILTFFWHGQGEILTNKSNSSIATNNFIDWFINNGGRLNKLTISEFEFMGNGFKAIETINPKDEIIYVPSSLIFCAKSLIKSNDFHVAQIAKHFKQEQAIKAWILLEYLKKEKSTYYAYFNILPTYIPSVLHFSYEELIQLQNPILLKEAVNLQSKLHSEYETFLSIASSFWPIRSDDDESNDNNKNINSIEELITYDDYKWVTTIIDSRALRFRGEMYLAPMADIFNYSPHPDPRESKSGDFFLTHHILNNKHGSITILSDRQQSLNNQLMEDYGDNPDEIYLKYHGFVPENNPFRCVTLNTETILQYLPNLSESKNELISALQFKQPPQKCIDESGRLNKALEVYLTALSFTNSETENCLEIINKQVKRDWNKIFSDCQFSSTATLLEDIRSEVIIINKNQLSQSPPLSSLVLRTLKTLQNFIFLSVSTQFETSTVDDARAIEDIKSDNFSNNGLSIELRHRFLYLQYRYKMKLLWLKICKYYYVEECESKLTKNRINKSEESIDGIDDQYSKYHMKIIDDNNNNDNNNNKNNSNELNKKDILLIQKIDDFNAWFDRFDPKPNLLIAKHIPPYRIGTITKAVVNTNQAYLGVPLAAILDSDLASKPESSVFELINKLREKYGDKRDDFHELLFLLINEAFVLQQRSKYWPYIDVLPKFEDMDIPLLWTKAQINQRLDPSYLKEHALDYQAKTFRMYNTLKNNDIIVTFFTPEIFTFRNYQWATAILDSRAIWWSGKRHLVPMLDFINCKENENNPNRLHSTRLDSSNKYALTLADRYYEEGEQLFENYGQPNHIYFLYHGFTLFTPSSTLNNNSNNNSYVANSHDCVNIDFKLAENEKVAINWDKANKILKNVGLSISAKKETVMTGCLSYPVPKKIWRFLSLKMNMFEDLFNRQLLDEPVPELINVLLSIIDSRIDLYLKYKPSHESSFHFISSELDLLQRAKKSLENDYKIISEKSFDDEL
eukprot:gene4607-6484_t